MIFKILHLTSAHSRDDTRIFLKMCLSLARGGYEVIQVVADGKGDYFYEGVQIIDVGSCKGRLDRIRNSPKRVFKRAASLNADLYHLHDPELIPIGLKLKRLGKCVVFDFHEDVPKQLLGKPYLNKAALWCLSKSFAIFESYACKRFDGVIAATPFIRNKFLTINPNTVDINNFPMLGELATDVEWGNKQAEVCYVGGIAKIRGITEVCQAMGMVQTKARLNLCGGFSELGTKQSVKDLPGWQKVNDLGFVDRLGVREVLSRSVAGLVTFHPLPNHVDAQPNKMFEYMSAGIPVIASDFPLWREIIQGNDCGLLVDPLDPAAIAQAIDYLVSNPREAQRMGANGRKAVNERYNWAIEEQKLFAFYDRTFSYTDK
ncbi:glycosyltransferase family 4 protein [Limnohabitans sp. 2KL-3]|uniref:glycosyltransferase family 4 protein n=1 Tax=Limnohabitans sp. 2KL-3 TaxID=1100700 RepID=UPI000B2E7348|nr:glycosyltransferase family 4 protein [Limnohabitans sp. 2KL-3]